jgi:ribosomal protein S18 acetylase RimI-like enzyme
MLFLRNARQADIPEIHRIVRENLREEYDPGLLWQFAQAWHEGSLVAEDTGAINGYILAVKHSPTEARILLFIVVPPWQGRGIGSYMLGALINQCALAGLKSVCLETRVSNQLAIRFYTKAGFSINAVLNGYYTDGEGAYLMRRNL